MTIGLKESVAIILVNWNSYNDTYECLKSLEKIDYKYYKIMLVDNASEDNSYYRLLDDYNQGKFGVEISFFRNELNLGFAGGNNIGIKKALDEGFAYFWLLNNDTVVDRKALNALVMTIKSNSDLGIVGSKIYYHNTDNIWFAGGKVNTWTGRAKHIGIKEKDNEDYNNPKSVDYITGCSLLFKREVIETIGYMNEDYFLYYEETEWNIRANKHGWGIRYEPSSIVYHKVSMASGGENNLAPYVAYYYIRNSLVMIKRTQPKIKFIINVSFQILNVIKELIKVYIKGSNNKLLRIRFILLGFIYGLKEKMIKHYEINEK
ncbi:glycosyltransferase family 2 protein [Niallia circulans]|uniref:glycosyltransferase family 2 protein n=1 Tax=Niallia circulans TaxID=1397 RepID=UPI003513B1AE